MRLTYIGLAHLNLTLSEIEVMRFGHFLDLVDCWMIETGRAEPARRWFIDDVIPDGI